MTGGYGTSFDAENDFVLNFHISAEFRKELKSNMRLKTASTHKEAIYGEMDSHEEQIQSISKNLKTCVNPFNGAARNIATGAEVPVSIVSGLLSSSFLTREISILKEYQKAVSLLQSIVTKKKLLVTL